MLDVGVEVFPGFLEIGNGLVKMPAVIPGFHEGEQGTQGLGDVPDDPEVDAGPPRCSPRMSSWMMRGFLGYHAE